MTDMLYFEDIINTLRAPLLVLDSSLRIVTANRAFVTTFGTGDVTGSAFSHIGDGCWRSPELEERLGSVARGVVAVNDLELTGDFHGIGRRTFLVNALRMPARPGEQQCVMISLEDVTAQRNAEAEAERLMAELNRSNEELERFAYVASHDLQEPLRMVASYTQIIASKYGDLLDEKGQRYVEFAVDGARRMQALINGLLDYSRIGTRGGTLAEVDVGDIVQAVLRDVALMATEAGAVITVDELPRVHGDAQQLMRVFQNLLVNALKFRSGESPRIHVGATVEAGEAVFYVKDNGIGIDAKYFERMFIVFQRLHTRTEYPGHGLGLAITKRIIERHGGRIWVESIPQAGSTFFFSLRLAQDKS